MIKKLSLFICFSCNVCTWSCTQFPLTKTVTQTPQKYAQLHKFLCKKVITQQRKQAGRNAFSCAFLITTNKNNTKIIYIDTINSIEIEPFNFFKIFENRMLMGSLGLPTSILNKATALSSQFNQLQRRNDTILSSVNISKHIFTEGCFFNSNQLPLFVFQEEELKCTKILLTNTRKELQASKDILQKLFFEYILTIISRSQPAGTKNGNSAHYCIYNSDSELHALYVLQCMIDDIARGIAKHIPEDEKITTIEFHGCTTRDMCPLCYTNINCMQFLANNNQKVGILGILSNRLKKPGSIDDAIHSATFISSLEEFPSKKGGESQGNLLWVTNPMLPTIEPGFVYQFRFTPNEIIEIDQAAEEDLKAAANITDISSLIPSLKEEPLATAQPDPTKPAAAVNSAPALTTGTPPVLIGTQDTTPTKLETNSTAPANK